MQELTARDIMTTDVIAVSPDTTLREIAELLVEWRISGVPVVDLDRQVVGIVSEADLIDEEKRQVALPGTVRFGAFPLPGQALEQAYEEGDMLTARELMSKPVFTLSEETPAPVIADELLARKVNRIPITRDGSLVGIVTRTDVLKALHGYWKQTEQVQPMLAAA